MRYGIAVAVAVVWIASGLSNAGAAPEASDEFRSLFNGQDLSGWVDVNVAPETFGVRDGVIFCTGKPTGVMRTEKQYENFILELEWKHLHQGGNAGLFVWSDPLPARGVPFTRAMEVQILDGRNTEDYTSHGDVFAIHGAEFTPNRPHPNGWMRSLPSERRCRPAGHWNHYRVVCRDGEISLAVNGKQVSGGHHASPRKGYICLESEGSEVLFRNIRVKRLPSTSPKPAAIADVARGFETLYNGLNLKAWRVAAADRQCWKADNWRLVATPKKQDGSSVIWTEMAFEDFELICDWRWTESAKTKESQDDGSERRGLQGNRNAGICLRGNRKAEVDLRRPGHGSGAISGYLNDASLSESTRVALTPRIEADRPIGQWNRMRITLRGRQISVKVNDKSVINQSSLPGVPDSGPIGLQTERGRIEFANVFVKSR